MKFNPTYSNEKAFKEAPYTPAELTPQVDASSSVVDTTDATPTAEPDAVLDNASESRPDLLWLSKSDNNPLTRVAHFDESYKNIDANQEAEYLTGKRDERSSRLVIAEHGMRYLGINSHEDIDKMDDATAQGKLEAMLYFLTNRKVTDEDLFFGLKTKNMKKQELLGRVYDYVKTGDYSKLAPDLERFDNLPEAERQAEADDKESFLTKKSQEGAVYGKAVKRMPQEWQEWNRMEQALQYSRDAGSAELIKKGIKDKYPDFNPDDPKWNKMLNGYIEEAMNEMPAMRVANRRKELQEQAILSTLEKSVDMLSPDGQDFVRHTLATDKFDKQMFERNVPREEWASVAAAIAVGRGKDSNLMGFFDLREESPVNDALRSVFGAVYSVTDTIKDVNRTADDWMRTANAYITGMWDKQAMQKSLDRIEVEHNAHNAMTRPRPDATSGWGKAATGFTDNFGSLLLGWGTGAAINYTTKAAGIASKAANVAIMTSRLTAAEKTLETAKAAGATGTNLAKLVKAVDEAKEGVRIAQGITQAEEALASVQEGVKAAQAARQAAKGKEAIKATEQALKQAMQAEKTAQQALDAVNSEVKLVYKPWEALGTKLGNAQSAYADATKAAEGNEFVRASLNAKELSKFKEEYKASEQAWKNSAKLLDEARKGNGTVSLENALGAEEKTRKAMSAARSKYIKAWQDTNFITKEKLAANASDEKLLKDILDARKQYERAGKTIEIAGKTINSGAKWTMNAGWYMPFYTRRLDEAVANGEPMEVALWSSVAYMLVGGAAEKAVFVKAGNWAEDSITATRTAWNNIFNVLRTDFFGGAELMGERMLANFAHGAETAVNITGESLLDEWTKCITKAYNEQAGKTGAWSKEAWMNAFMPTQEWCDMAAKVIENGTDPAIGFFFLSPSSARMMKGMQARSNRYYAALNGGRADAAPWSGKSLDPDEGLVKARNDFHNAIAATRAYWEGKGIEANERKRAMAANRKERRQAQRDSDPKKLMDETTEKVRETIRKVFDIADNGEGINTVNIMAATGVDQATAETLLTVAQEVSRLAPVAEAEAMYNELRSGTVVYSEGMDINGNVSPTGLFNYVTRLRAQSPTVVENNLRKWIPNVKSVKVGNDGGAVVVTSIDGEERTIGVRATALTKEMIAEMAKVDNPASCGEFNDLIRSDSNFSKRYNGRTWEQLSDAEREEVIRTMWNGSSDGKLNGNKLMFTFEGVDIAVDDIIDIRDSEDGLQGGAREFKHETSHNIFRVAKKLGYITEADEAALADAIGIDKTKKDWQVAVDEYIARGFAEYMNGRSIPAIAEVLDGYKGAEKVIKTINQMLTGFARSVLPEQAQPWRNIDKHGLDGFYKAMMEGNIKDIRNYIPEGTGGETAQGTVETLRSSILGEVGVSRLDDATDILDGLAIAKDYLGGRRWSKLTHEEKRKIKYATGWEMGGDGKWRYETEDLFPAVEPRSYDGTLGDYFSSIEGVLVKDYQRFFQAYPEARSVQLVVNLKDGYGWDGAYYPDRNLINLNIGKHASELDVRTAFAHEIQHFVQDKEGFAEGGNKNTLGNIQKAELLQSAFSDFDAMHKDIASKIAMAVAPTSQSINYFDWWANNIDDNNNKGLISFLSNSANIDNASDLIYNDKASMKRVFRAVADVLREAKKGTKGSYRKLAGEVESYNLQGPRFGWNAERRRNNLLEDTEDVARESQIYFRTFADGMRKLDDGIRRYSLVTPAEDAAYMDAVNRGDMETAQRMVREAAAKAMPSTKVVGKDGLPLVVYHGTTEEFNEFDPNEIGSANGFDRAGYFFTDEKREVADYYTYGRGRVIGALLNLENPLIINSVKYAYEHGISLDEIETSLNIPISLWDRLHETIEKDMENGGHDGVWIQYDIPAWNKDEALGKKIRDYGESDQDIEDLFMVRKGYESSIKSADPVTYDDNGNVIPLSKRFDAGNRDVRWSLAEPHGTQKSAYTAYPDASEEVRAMGNLSLLSAPVGKFSKAKLDEVLSSLSGKELINDATGMVAEINSVQRRKLESNAAVRKSEANGFTKDEHNAVTSIIEYLWRYAEPASKHDDKNGDKGLDVHRFVSIAKIGTKDVFPYITVKKHITQNNSRIYSIEVEKIETLEGTLKDLNLSSSSVTSIISRLLSKVNDVSKENTVTSIVDAAATDNAAIDFSKRSSFSTEDMVEGKIRANKALTTENGWTTQQVEDIISETADIIRAIHEMLSGNARYDEWVAKKPTVRVDWRDGKEKPVVMWVRGNVEYKYDMSADLLCINNEGLEEVLSSPVMADLMVHTAKYAANNKSLDEKYRGYASDDYLRLYETLRDMGFVVPCKGCFDAAMRLKMLPSVAQKFVKAVNDTIDKRNKNVEAFDANVRSWASDAVAKAQEDANRINARIIESNAKRITKQVAAKEKLAKIQRANAEIEEYNKTAKKPKALKVIPKSLERDLNPKLEDLKMPEQVTAINGLPLTAGNKDDAIAIAVAGDNLTKHVTWTQLMSAKGQTQALADWGGLFRSWQKTGAGRPKDKLLPEPWTGDMMESTFTIIGSASDKTPSFREVEVNCSTGLRRNSHAEYRPLLAVDEIQFMREAYLKRLWVFKYMKELDDVRLFGNLGVKFNMSFFPAFVEDGVAAGLDANGDYIAAEESVGGREFEYKDAEGNVHYDGMKGFNEAKKYVNEDCSLSSVIFSVPHLIKALTDVPTPKDKSGIWGSLIGFHNSGATKEQIRRQGLGVERACDSNSSFFVEAMSDYHMGVTNFEQVQNDRFGEGWECLEGASVGKDVTNQKLALPALGKHYYNKTLGVHLFSGFYILDSELGGRKITSSSQAKSELSDIAHPFSVDYNDMVRTLGMGPDGKIKDNYAYKSAADYYIATLRKLGLRPRFDFNVPKDIFLDMCSKAKIDPNHPKLGWKGGDWSPCDSDAYYALFCDYGMTDPATGFWSPHRAVGYKEGFKLPDNYLKIIKEGVDRYSNRLDVEESRRNEAIVEYCRREIVEGKAEPTEVARILKENGFTDKEIADATLPESQRRLSLSLPPDVDGRTSDDDLLEIAAAGKLARDPATEQSVRSDVVRRTKALNPTMTDDDAEAYADSVMKGAKERAKGVKNAVVSGVNDSDLINELTRRQIEKIQSANRKAARIGMTEGVRADKALNMINDRVAQIVADAVAAETGLAANEIETDYGIDLSETLIAVRDLMATQPKDTSAEEDAEEEDAEDVAPLTEEEAKAQAEAKKAREDEMSALIEEIRLQAWLKTKDRESKREAREDEKWKRATEEAGKEADDAEGDVDDFPDSPAEIAKIALTKRRIDLRNPEHFAEFVVALVENRWRETHGIDKNVDIWHDKVALQHLRMTANNVYTKLAKNLTYSHFRERALQACEEMKNAPTIASAVSSMVYAGKVIAQTMVKETQKELIKDIEQLLEEKFGAKGRFKQNEENLKRKVSGATELWARDVKKVINFSVKKVEKELERVRKLLETNEVEFTLNEKDAEGSKVFYDNTRYYAILMQYGALKHKPIGQIHDARGTIMDRLGADNIGEEAKAREERTLETAEFLAKAFDSGEKYLVDEKTMAHKVGKYFAEHLDFKHYLLDLTRKCKDPAVRKRAEAYINGLQHDIQRAWDKARNEEREQHIWLRKTIEAIYGKSFGKVMREMMKPDARFDEFGTLHEYGKDADGNTVKVVTSNVKMSKAQAMQLYVSMQQKGYLRNVTDNDRQGQSQRIRALFTPEDIKLMAAMGQWYEQNRKGISEVSERLFGLPVLAEEANYFPVSPYKPREGLEEGTSVGWNPFPPSLTSRVRHTYDFDVRRDIFSMWAGRMKEQAQWKNFADIGVELRGIFGRRVLQASVIRNHGADSMDFVKGFINDILNGSYRDASPSGQRQAIDNARSWAALFALGGNLGVMIKQTTSIPAVALEVGFADTAKHLMTAFTPIGMEAMRDIWNSYQRKTRWDSGNSEEVANALADNNPSAFKKLLRRSMIFNQVGDCVPALVMGQGIYRNFLKQGLSQEEAMNRTWEIINRTQQTSQMDNLSGAQRRSAWGRAMFQFQSTVRQYAAYEITALRDLMANPTKGDAWVKACRATVVTHMVLPSLYYLAGVWWQSVLGKDPDDDFLQNWAISCLVGPWSSLFFLGALMATPVTYFMNQKKEVGTSLPSQEMAANLVLDASKIVYTAVSAFDDDSEVTLDDFLQAVDDSAKHYNATYRDTRKLVDYRIRGIDPNERKHKGKRRPALPKIK